MRIEIVTHCWAGACPHFADALRLQLDSLARWRPDGVDVVPSVWFLESDHAVADVVERSTIRVTRFAENDVHRLGRRSIGRNFSAITTRADLVWFADCDLHFGAGCLEALARLEWPEGATMVYPRHAMISRDHATGDAQLARAGRGDLLLPPDEFIPFRYPRAIGGVQIVRGDFAREHGYLNGVEKWQRPTETSFGDFRDDVAYRNYCRSLGRIVPVELPGLRRIRHSTTTYQ